MILRLLVYRHQLRSKKWARNTLRYKCGRFPISVYNKLCTSDFINGWMDCIAPGPEVMPKFNALHTIACHSNNSPHDGDAIMGTMAPQITGINIVNSTVWSGTDQRKHQSSSLLVFVWGIHRWPVNSPHKWPVTRKIFPFDDVIMKICGVCHYGLS